MGSAQPINPVLRGFVEGCEGVESLCYYGIIHNATRLEMAHEILTREGYSLTGSGDYSYIENLEYEVYERASNEGCNIVWLLYEVESLAPRTSIGSLEDCHGITVGDGLELFGIPRIIFLSRNYSGFFFDNDIQIVFKGNPRLHSLVINVWTINGEAGVAGIGFDWQGFVPLWRYCIPIPVEECLPF